LEGGTGDYIAMKRRYSFLWIDDDQSRKNLLDTIKKKLNVDGEFIDVTGENIVTKIEEILSKSKFDLILMDHILNGAAEASIQTGSTTAEYIRETKPDCPIVGITAVKVTDIDFHKKSIYEDLFEVSKISEHYDSILSIAKSYSTLVEKRPQNNDDLIGLLKAPKDITERLTIIIPEEIKRNYEDKSLLINISKWIRHSLMLKPGFLYDQLWAATLIGLKADSFHKVEQLFKKAKYVGLFSDKGNERWWQAQIRQIIYSNYPHDQSTFPWHLGHLITGIEKIDHSVCHVCKKEFPETVGYTDEMCKTRAPMHLRCSSIHPNFESTLYYDDRRIMVPAK
jgi:hypothetical protein